MKHADNIIDYISNVTGWKIEGPYQTTGAIPLYIKSAYDIFEVRIEGKQVIFAEARQLMSNIGIHRNAQRKIEDICGCKVVLVFESIGSREANSLISSKVPFVVPDRHIYMPFAYIALYNIEKKKEVVREGYKRLTPDADLILVGYISRVLQSGMILSEISELVCRDLRTVSQAISLLKHNGYATVHRDGRSRIVRFVPHMDAYERLMVDGLQPVLRSFFVSLASVQQLGICSGDSALSKYTQMMDGRIPTVAFGVRQSAILDNMQHCSREEAAVRVEVWDRDPVTFSVHKCINPFYLLRLYAHSEDERIKVEIEKLKVELEDKIERNG